MTSPVSVTPVGVVGVSQVLVDATVPAASRDIGDCPLMVVSVSDTLSDKLWIGFVTVTSFTACMFGPSPVCFYPSVPILACNCNGNGTDPDLICDPTTGVCLCAALMVGDDCSQCNTSRVHIVTEEGCQGE